MHLVLAISAALLVTAAAGEGFVHFDVEKKATVTANNRLRRQATNPINAQLAQNLANRQEYIINMTVGTPGQKVGVTLDTGSSDLWIPSASFCRSHKCDFSSFNPSRSSTYQLIEAGGFNITYAAPGDSDAGDWASDSVSIGDSATMDNQTFGLSNQGYDVHGVLGIGFDTHETSGPDKGMSYSSVVDNMVQSGLIARRAYSMYLNSYNQTFGSIVFGGVDSTKYTGDLVSLPLQQGIGGEGVTEFFVTLSRVTFTDATGVDSVLTPDGYAQSVLLDSGTSYTVLTTDVFERLAGGMGAVDIDSSESLTVPCSYKNTNATISYTFGGSDGVTVTVPVSETIGAQTENECAFGFGSTFASGGVSVLGDTFLRSAYVVFDIDNSEAALAQAVNGKQGASSIVAIPSGAGIPGVSSTASATGTQLSGADATRSASLVIASTHHSSIIAGTPTFSLGVASTTGTASSSNAAMVHAVTGLSQAALWGAGLVAGAFVL